VEQAHTFEFLEVFMRQNKMNPGIIGLVLALSLPIFGCKIESDPPPPPPPEPYVFTGNVNVFYEGQELSAGYVVVACTDNTDKDTILETEVGRSGTITAGAWWIEVSPSAIVDGSTVYFAVLYEDQSTGWKVNCPESEVIDETVKEYENIDLGLSYFTAEKTGSSNVFTGNLTAANEGVPITGGIAVIACTDNTDFNTAWATKLGYDDDIQNGNFIVHYDDLAEETAVKFVVSYSPSGTWSDTAGDLQNDLEAQILTATVGTGHSYGIDIGSYFGGDEVDHGWDTHSNTTNGWGAASWGSTSAPTIAVDPQGVVTITSGGGGNEASMWHNYYAHKDTQNVFRFEAWTDSGTRTLTGNYWQTDGAGQQLPWVPMEINTEHKIFTIAGDPLPVSGPVSFMFYVDGNTTPFHIRMISIKTLHTGELNWTNLGPGGQYANGTSAGWRAVNDGPGENTSIWTNEWTKLTATSDEDGEVITFFLSEAVNSAVERNAWVNFAWATVGGFDPASMSFIFEYEAWVEDGDSTAQPFDFVVNYLHSGAGDWRVLSPVRITTEPKRYKAVFPMIEDYPTATGGDKGLMIQIGNLAVGTQFKLKPITCRTADYTAGE
jgi:hypothetical protein